MSEQLARASCVALLCVHAPPKSLLRKMGDRRGNFSYLMALLILVMLGFAALTVDWGRAVLAGTQAQQIADSAAQAAVFTLKRTGDQTQAQNAAQLVVDYNQIAGDDAQLLDFDVGSWDANSRVWDTLSASNNAVRVTVGRQGANAIPLPLAGLLGFPTASVSRTATAATQNLQVVLVMDITASWDKDNFYNARAAAVTFLDELHNAHGVDDIIGMTVFLQRFGWEFTPFTLVSDSAADPALIRNKWAAMSTGSHAGTYQSSWVSLTSKHIACKTFATNNNGNNQAFAGICSSGSSCYQPSNRDNYSASGAVGGCFPNMPRYYLDEPGTDHTTGMTMAETMFSENPDPMAYRAMVVLTDGQPSAYGSASGSKRVAQRYTETRFREYRYANSHTVNQIESETVNLAQDMYANQDVNIWFVSFVSYDSFMEQASQGDGWFTLASSSADIITVFRTIARSLPIAVVE